MSSNDSTLCNEQKSEVAKSKTTVKGCCPSLGKDPSMPGLFAVEKSERSESALETDTIKVLPCISYSHVAQKVFHLRISNRCRLKYVGQNPRAAVNMLGSLAYAVLLSAWSLPLGRGVSKKNTFLSEGMTVSKVDKFHKINWVDWVDLRSITRSTSVIPVLEIVGRAWRAHCQHCS